MNIRMKERQHNGEIVVYQPDEITRLEVMVENCLQRTHIPFWNIWVMMENKSYFRGI